MDPSTVDPNLLSVLLSVIANGLTAFIAQLRRKDSKLLLGEELQKKIRWEETALQPILQRAIKDVEETLEWQGLPSLNIICLFLLSPQVEEVVHRIYSVICAENMDDTISKNLEKIQDEFLVLFSDFIASYPSEPPLTEDQLASSSNLLWDTLIEGSERALDAAIDNGILSALAAKSTYQHQLILDSINTLPKQVSFLVSQQKQDIKTALLEELKYPDHQGLLESRTASFVPGTRQIEITEVAKLIGQLRSSGGYLAITGQAGEGKTTLIAQLIEVTFKRENPIYHFIPFSPDPNHQGPLLRSLMASLVLKHNYLSDQWMEFDDYNLLANSFAKMLQKISEKGDREIIFIDGLDQIWPNTSIRRRDISFLPAKLPKGIVIVLGTRPDDTLRYLEFHDYRLPGLSPTDFDLMLAHHNVHLDKGAVSFLFEKMERNVLYLDLVAKALEGADAVKVEDIIRQVSNNPENIFSFSIERLKLYDWEKVIRPVLGLLLSAQQPLTAHTIERILDLRHDALEDGLQQLGGLLTKNERKQYYLYHLKLRDFLQEDPSRPDKNYIFTKREEEAYHKLLADWCEKGGKFMLADIWQDSEDAVEQERREYARRHYIVHLFQAEEWERLWAVLNEGNYGQAKVQRFDPSMQSYAQDIHIGRLAASRKEWQFKEGLEMLPKLWKYSLLWHSLANRADNYPEEAFETMVLLGRVQEAMGLANLLNEPIKKIKVLVRIAKQWWQQNGRLIDVRELLLSAGDEARELEQDQEKIQTLCIISEALVEIGEKEIAARILSEAELKVQYIEPNESRVWALCALAVSLHLAQETEMAVLSLAQAKELAISIEGNTNLLGKVAGALAMVGQKEEAIALLAEATKQSRSSNDPFEIVSEEKERAWRQVVETLANYQEWNEAITVAHSMKNSWEKTHALKKIASRLASDEKSVWALEVLTEAVDLAHAIERHFSDSDDNIFGQRFMANFQYDMGGSSHKSVNTETYIVVLSELAVEMDAIGERGQALKLITEAVAKVKRIKHMRIIPVMTEVTTALIKLCEIKVASELFAEIKELIRSSSQNTEEVDERSLSKKARTINSEINALCSIAYILATIGEQEKAERLLIEAKKLARLDLLSANSFRIRDVRDLALFTVASASSGVKLWDKAEEAVYLMNCIMAGFNFDAVCLVAERLGADGQGMRARTLVKTIKVLSDSDRVRAFCRVAKALATGGEKSDAILGLTDAEVLVQSLEESWNTREIVCEWVRTWAEIGEWEQAKALAQNLKENRDKVTSFSEIASIIAKKGEKRAAQPLIEEAEQLLVKIKKGDQFIDPAAGTLAKAMADMGMWDKAIEIARTISSEDPKAKPNTLSYIAATMVRAGEWKRAEVLVETIKEIGYRSHVYFDEIGVAFAEVGAYDKAVSLARSYDESDDKVVALSRVATRLNNTKEKAKVLQLLSEAEKLVRNTEKRSYKGNTVSSATTKELAIALAEIGAWDSVETIVSLIVDSDEKAQALCEISYNLCLAGESSQALQLLQSSWLHANKRNTAIQLLPMAIPLMMLNSKTIWEFYSAVEWVDRILDSI